jgi:hypothetical protein
MQPGSDEITIFRLSDGRPFRHRVGAEIEQVISHAASAVLVLITPRGLVRLHCFAHALSALETPWRTGSPLAQLVLGNEPLLIGIAGDEIWRVPIGLPPTQAPASTHAAPVASAPAQAVPAPAPAPEPPLSPAWRAGLVELARALNGEQVTWPTIDPRSELAAIASTLELSELCRNALAALYARYLVGEPYVAIATLAGWLSWASVIGDNELDAHALLDRGRLGHVALRTSVCDALDGRPPAGFALARAGAAALRGRIVHEPANMPSATLLASVTGRALLVDRDVDDGLLAARLLDATAIVTVPVPAGTQFPRGVSAVLATASSPTPTS